MQEGFVVSVSRTLLVTTSANTGTTIVHTLVNPLARLNGGEVIRMHDMLFATMLTGMLVAPLFLALKASEDRKQG